jgi:hypothetical protein
MVLKRLIGLAFAGALICGVAAADIVVRIAPPRVQVQKRDRAPGRGYQWVQGYQSYDGRGYVWVPGRWEQPPRPGAHWVGHRWNRQRGGGWVMVEGHWR